MFFVFVHRFFHRTKSNFLRTRSDHQLYLLKRIQGLSVDVSGVAPQNWWVGIVITTTVVRLTVSGGSVNSSAVAVLRPHAASVVPVPIDQTLTSRRGRTPTVLGKRPPRPTGPIHGTLGIARVLVVDRTAATRWRRGWLLLVLERLLVLVLVLHVVLVITIMLQLLTVLKMMVARGVLSRVRRQTVVSRIRLACGILDVAARARKLTTAAVTGRLVVWLCIVRPWFELGRSFRRLFGIERRLYAATTATGKHQVVRRQR